ncbi:hypothetical protein BESB_063240 [Besnoitia besnoiti]|uniref:IQ calmodulin-binding motif domain-containing protein n=1 Tax=Besnoitia besnoiti TaxID=94643 RepID=A0A2A9MIM4_BESBE|nr:hypothetical protein BESB_063240 [Besnoitia besnoiti]PFH35437.1 hypothetical protein BESB_063240 [Besnoitia besnoiti]
MTRVERATMSVEDGRSAAAENLVRILAFELPQFLAADRRSRQAQQQEKERRRAAAALLRQASVIRIQTHWRQFRQRQKRRARLRSALDLVRRFERRRLSALFLHALKQQTQRRYAGVKLLLRGMEGYAKRIQRHQTAAAVVAWRRWVRDARAHAAARIQALWRGRRAREEFKRAQTLAAVDRDFRSQVIQIQAAVRGMRERRSLRELGIQLPKEKKRNAAAAKIQSLFRGHRARRRLRRTLEGVRSVTGEVLEALQEVDVSEFIFLESLPPERFSDLLSLSLPAPSFYFLHARAASVHPLASPVFLRQQLFQGPTQVPPGQTQAQTAASKPESAREDAPLAPSAFAPPRASLLDFESPISLQAALSSCEPSLEPAPSPFPCEDLAPAGRKAPPSPQRGRAFGSRQPSRALDGATPVDADEAARACKARPPLSSLSRFYPSFAVARLLPKSLQTSVGCVAVGAGENEGEREEKQADADRLGKVPPPPAETEASFGAWRLQGTAQSRALPSRGGQPPAPACAPTETARPSLARETQTAASEKNAPGERALSQATMFLWKSYRSVLLPFPSPGLAAVLLAHSPPQSASEVEPWHPREEPTKRLPRALLEPLLPQPRAHGPLGGAGDAVRETPFPRGLPEAEAKAAGGGNERGLPGGVAGGLQACESPTGELPTDATCNASTLQGLSTKRVTGAIGRRECREPMAASPPPALDHEREATLCCFEQRQSVNTSVLTGGASLDSLLALCCVGRSRRHAYEAIRRSARHRQSSQSLCRSVSSTSPPSAAPRSCGSTAHMLFARLPRELSSPLLRPCGLGGNSPSAGDQKAAVCSPARAGRPGGPRGGSPSPWAPARSAGRAARLAPARDAQGEGPSPLCRRGSHSPPTRAQGAPVDSAGAPLCGGTNGPFPDEGRARSGLSASPLHSYRTNGSQDSDAVRLGVVATSQPHTSAPAPRRDLSLSSLDAKSTTHTPCASQAPEPARAPRPAASVRALFSGESCSEKAAFWGGAAVSVSRQQLLLRRGTTRAERLQMTLEKHMRKTAGSVGRPASAAEVSAPASERVTCTGASAVALPPRGTGAPPAGPATHGGTSRQEVRHHLERVRAQMERLPRTRKAQDSVARWKLLQQVKALEAQEARLAQCKPDGGHAGNE